MKKANKAEYLGTIFHNKADPRLEVTNRMNKAAVGRRRLKTFWAKGGLDKIQKLLIY